MNNMNDAARNALETCQGLKPLLIDFAEAFLWAAIVIAVLGALADLAIKLQPLLGRTRSYPPTRTAAPVDPVKFLDALKGLIDALTKAPAWIAIFLAAMALLWAVKNLVPTCP